MSNEDLVIGDRQEEDEPGCPRCGEIKANHGNYASGEDWTCPDQDGYGKEIGQHGQIARMVERMHDPHDRRFKTAIEIADAKRRRE